VRHIGRSKTCSRPWFWQKRMKVASGMSRIWPVGQDQMAAAIGSRYQSEKAAEFAGFQEVAQAALVVRVAEQPGRALAVEAQDVGEHGPEGRRSRLRFWPKMVARLLPAHSRSGFSRLTAKDISVSTLSTPSSANIAIRLG
jgi:hypothetical protein